MRQFATLLIDAAVARADEMKHNLGIYVIWDGRAKARPTYIGEGNILQRFVEEHHDRFDLPFDGFVSVLSGPDITWQRAARTKK